MPLRSFKALGNLMEFEGFVSLVSLLAMVLDVIWVIWVIFNLKHITKVLISMRDVRLSLRCVTLAILHSGAANLQESFDWFSVIFTFSATVTGFTLQYFLQTPLFLVILSISVGWLSWLVNCVDLPVRPSQLWCGCATDYSIGRARGRMHKRFSGFTDVLGNWIPKKRSKGKS